MTAMKELTTVTRLGKIMHSPSYFIYTISTSLLSPNVIAQGFEVVRNQTAYSNVDNYYDRSQTVNDWFLACERMKNNFPGTMSLENSFSSIDSFAISTVLNAVDSEAESNDFAVKPKYTKEFRLRVKYLRINKSTPKIFED